MSDMHQGHGPSTFASNLRMFIPTKPRPCLVHLVKSKLKPCIKSRRLIFDPVSVHETLSEGLILRQRLWDIVLAMSVLSILSVWNHISVHMGQI